ncbi:hypothetical protein Naga_100183g8 [Nannochloropsis gaditana]|uniref:Uncharacterized protein n=1 Tax=Nannochloropsis gaditana TaxID=72520 RepID=W7TDT4_9STRA|nr:hypothetical protein Naga_100183g8 [Nannochloropsis gaditana]
MKTWTCPLSPTRRSNTIPRPCGRWPSTAQLECASKIIKTRTKEYFACTPWFVGSSLDYLGIAFKLGGQRFIPLQVPCKKSRIVLSALHFFFSEGILIYLNLFSV